MILNEKVIQNKILQRTLIQQIIKLQSKIIQIPKYCQLIQKLGNKVESQQILLQRIKHDTYIKTQQIAHIKNILFKEFEKKSLQRNKLHDNASDEMRKLNQTCSQIRNKKQEIKDSIKTQNKLLNQLQELQILYKESQSQILSYQFLRIEQQKEQKDLLEYMRQKQAVIDSQRLQKQKQANLSGILSQNLIQIESKVSKLTFQKSKLEISQALLISELQKIKGEVKNLQNEHKNKKLRIFQIQSNITKDQFKIQDQLGKTNNNKDQSQNLRNKIERSLQEANEINDKIIKTRQFVLSLNIAKNQQKKVNQKLRLKIRQLMKNTLGLNNDSPEL